MGCLSFLLLIYRNFFNSGDKSLVRYKDLIRKIFSLEVSRFFGDQSDWSVCNWQKCNSNSRSRVQKKKSGGAWDLPVTYCCVTNYFIVA